MHPGWVVAHVHIIDKSHHGIFYCGVWALNGGITEIQKFSHVTFAAMGTSEPHTSSMKIRLRTRTTLIDKAPRGKSIEAICAR